MAPLVYEFLGIIGVDVLPPENLVELIPYLLEVLVGITLVSGVFWVVGKIVDVFTDFRHW